MTELSVLQLGKFEETPGHFYCRRFSEHLRAHQPTITVPHKHDFFLTVLFTQGGGTHEIDFEQHPVKPGSVFLLNPGQTHHWELSDDIEGIIFFHSQEYFEVHYARHALHHFPFFYSVHNPSAIFLVGEAAHRIEQSFEQLLAEASQPQAWSQEKIAALLSSLYIDLSRQYPEHDLVLKPEVQGQHLRELESLIEQHYKTEKSPTAYAELLHITLRHLNRLTQHTLGKSPTQLITERTLLEAKRLMVHGNLSLTEIAYALGFEDYAYFSRLFKKWTGVSPTEFAKGY